VTNSLAGSIDSPAAGETVAPGVLHLTGWAVGAAGPPTDLQVTVEGASAQLVGRGLPSPWAGARFPGVPGSAAAGWEAVVDLRGLRATSLAVRLLARSGPRRWRELACSDVSVESEKPLAGSRSRAAFTIVQNEPDFLPVWLAHYRRFFDPEDIYLLDHDSTDGSTQGVEDACNVVPVHRTASFDHAWLRSTVEQFQSFLLGSYETVLFAEIDEFLVADPRRHAGLDSYIEGLREPAACCTGFDVVHYPSEAPLRFDQPILRQRGFWHRSPLYSKRLVARAPLAWGLGFHTELRFPQIRPDPDLYLVHLHRVDYERCLARHRASAARNWSEIDIATGAGNQNRIVAPEKFRHWFFNVDLGAADPEPIPEHLMSLL
jgi:hypothetical protein